MLSGYELSFDALFANVGLLGAKSNCIRHTEIEQKLMLMKKMQPSNVYDIKEK